jgi:hypothetical protein
MLGRRDAREATSVSIEGLERVAVWPAGGAGRCGGQRRWGGKIRVIERRDR